MKITFLSVCLLAFLFTFSTQVFAVDFTVNLTTDPQDANTADGICDVDLVTAGLQCSLRAAVEQGKALNSNDRILFDLPANSTITFTTATLTSPRLQGIIIENANLNTRTLEIIGTGANNLTIDGGAETNRIFTINGRLVVTISGLTLTGGNGAETQTQESSSGGAISVSGGSVTLDSVHVTGNSASNGSGGGVVFSSGTHRIINSTFSNNNAVRGGGVMNINATLTVINSTISGNNVTSSGGGFRLGRDSSTTLRNVTVTNNTAGNGGGLYVERGNGLNVGNTIIAGNTATNGGSQSDIFVDSTVAISPVTSVGGNLFVTPPMLGALQLNGGTTPTHALLPGSPAIDKGLNANVVLPTDQRGFLRIVDGDGNGTAIVDIGAFEFQSSPTAASVSVSGRVTTTSGRGIRNVVITMTDSNGNTRTATTTSFGYFRLDDVAAGETYIFAARGKRFSFGQNTQVHSITEDTSNINFIANDQSVFSVN